jgi:DNA-binding transcriptional MerR regulator
MTTSRFGLRHKSPVHEEISMMADALRARLQSFNPPGMHPSVAGEEFLPGIGDIAARYGVTARALRFYEARGLLKPVRTGQHRSYGKCDRVRLEMIIKAKQLGFRLSEIAAMLGPADENCEDLDLNLTVSQVSQQISQLEDQHRAINAALGELRRRLYLMTEVRGGDAIETG